jgi:hypothetical protein
LIVLTDPGADRLKKNRENRAFLRFSWAGQEKVGGQVENEDFLSGLSGVCVAANLERFST